MAFACYRLSAPGAECRWCEAMSALEEFEEGEETLAAIDRGIKAADEGRVVSLERPSWLSEWVRELAKRSDQSRFFILGTQRAWGRRNAKSAQVAGSALADAR